MKTLERTISMRGRDRVRHTNEFARWMDEAMDSRGINLSELAVLADISQPRLSQVRTEGTAPIKLIERLVTALLPVEIDPEQRSRTYNRLRQAAIDAAFPSQEITRTRLASDGLTELAPDELDVVARWRNMPPEEKRIVKRMLHMPEEAEGEDDYQRPYEKG